MVEAKRQSRDPRVAEQQVRHYVTEIAKHQSFQPFAFLTNGRETYFWDVDREHKRQVAGFLTTLLDRVSGQLGKASMWKSRMLTP